jgi:hypothetical protein
MRAPGRVHITWQDDNTLKLETDEGTQTRLFHFAPPGGPPPPAPQASIKTLVTPAGTVQVAALMPLTQLAAYAAAGSINAAVATAPPKAKPFSFRKERIATPDKVGSLTGLGHLHLQKHLQYP